MEEEIGTNTEKLINQNNPEKKSRWWIWLIVIIGIIFLILVVVLPIIIWQVVKGTLTEGDEGINSLTQCISLNLQISETNFNTNTISVQRSPGRGDLDKIMLLINGVRVDDLDASDLAELAEKDFSVEINSGDKIEIAPILNDGIICSISDTKTV